MSNKNNFVSVIMSTYNSINTLDTAIESIMNQTYKNLELLIMDDCSVDGSYEKINYFRESLRAKVLPYLLFLFYLFL